MEFLARNSRNLNASCAGALSWWRIHLSGESPGLLSFNPLRPGLKFSLQRQKIYGDLRKTNIHPLSLKGGLWF